MALRLHFYMDGTFKTASSSGRLKTYCLNALGLVLLETVVVDRFFKNGKWFKISFQYVSILKTLKNFLSHDDVQSNFNKQATNSDDVLYSFADSIACKSSALFSTDDMALRLHFYIDDFETCNPIVIINW